MGRALALAAQYRPHPNPRVGAVVVDAGGRVVGEGAHQQAGMAHAEAIALEAAGERARGGIAYVTLEPCDHHGRTPPCTDALIAARIKEVVVANIDPDQRVSGKGIARLKTAGIGVTTGLMGEAAEAIDPGYFHHRRTGRPLIVLKAALTLDGQIAAADGSSQWITGPEAREDAHRLRSEADAVMIGAGTMIADDPGLDVRLPGYQGPQPRPVVVAGNRPLPAKAQLWERNPLVITTTENTTTGEPLVVPRGQDGFPDLAIAVTTLGERGYLDILVEGGSTLAAGLWQAGLIDRGVFYLGAKLAGGKGQPAFSGIWPTLSASRSVEITSVRQLGADLRVDFLTYNPPPTSRHP